MKNTAPTIKIEKDARKKARSFHVWIQKLKADAQAENPNVDLIRKLSDQTLFRIKIMTPNHAMETMDLINTIISTKSPVSIAPIQIFPH